MLLQFTGGPIRAFAFPATGAHGRGVNEALSIECPHCGETFSLAFDESEGSAEFIIDCEVCCRPMSVAVRVADGSVDGVDVTEC